MNNNNKRKNIYKIINKIINNNRRVGVKNPYEEDEKDYIFNPLSNSNIQGKITIKPRSWNIEGVKKSKKD